MKTYYSNSKSRGFTLIEFLVASALAVIVIMAAGSTYFITRQLNVSAQERINVQNSLRNAATLMTRDARSAGNFGCFSTGGIFSGAAGTTAANTGSFPELNNVGIANGNNTIQMNNTANNGYGVIWTNNLSGFTLPDGAGSNVSNALIFVYGKGNVGLTTISANSAELINNQNVQITEAAANGGALVLSSCENALTLIPTGINGTNLNFNPVTLSSEMKVDNLGMLSISKLYAAAYVVARVNNTPTLLRYEMGADGNWLENPQVLSSNVSDMDVSFAYEQNCNTTQPNPANSITFASSSDLAHPNLPAIIQARLTYEGSVQTEYIINAGVRGGNQCSTQIEVN